MIRVIASVLTSLLLAGCISQQPVPAVDRSGATSRSSAQASGPGYYTVKRGDTLYRIAQEHGQDHRDIIAWNNIVNPAAIKEGQILRVAPPAKSDAETAISKPVETGSGVETRPLDQPVIAGGSAAASDGVRREPKVGKEPYSDEAYDRLSKGGESAKPGQPKTEVKSEVLQPAPATPSGPDDIVWIWPTSAKMTAPYSDSGNKGMDFAGSAGDPVLAAGDGKVVYAGRGLRGFGELVIVKHNGTYLSAYAHNRKILVKEGQQVARGQKIAEMGNTDAESVKLHFEIRKQGKPVDPGLYLPKR